MTDSTLYTFSYISVLTFQDSAGRGKYPGIASDRGQNRSLYFVSSELLNPVENCSSCRRVPLFVSSCSSFRHNSA